MNFSGLPHLAISSSTPPPPPSPLAIKVKAEPVSPPREQHILHPHPHISSGLSITSMDNGDNINIINSQHLVLNPRQNAPGHMSSSAG